MNRVLQFLNVSGTQIGDTGLEVIGRGLKHNSSLVSLDVSNNMIKSAKQLCQVLHLTGLQDLNLANNLIEDKQLEDFNAVLRKNSDTMSSHLQRLDLSAN